MNKIHEQDLKVSNIPYYVNYMGKVVVELLNNGCDYCFIKKYNLPKIGFCQFLKTQELPAMCESHLDQFKTIKYFLERKSYSA